MQRRNTIQRDLVLQTVRVLKNHASAEDVYNKISESHPSISKGTVYRNLNILANQGKILKVPVPGAADHFDHIIDEHCHVFCTKCGAVCDLDMEELPDIMGKAKATNGFDILGYDLIFRGVCPSCKSKV